MASYKVYSGSLDADPGTYTHDVLTDLGRTGRSGYIKNTGSNALTFALKFEDDTAFGDDVTLDADEVHGFDRDFYYQDKHGNDFIAEIKVDYVSADTTYKIYID